VAGQFLPYQQVELHAKVAGYIRHISVDIGDSVKAGQVLATLDVPELNAQVEGASAGVRQSQELIKRAASEVARAEANYDALHSASQRLQEAAKARPGLIAQQELDDASAREMAAAAQVDAAKSGLLGTRQQLQVSQANHLRYALMADYSRIVAPFSGVVTWRYADTGALIQAGTSNAASAPVVKIAEVDKLRLRLPVPESLAPFVHLGDAVTINVQALHRTMRGVVARMTDALDPSTRTMQVEIDVNNEDMSLTAGMYAEVTLNVNRSGNVLAVPVNAVDQSTDQPYVFIVDKTNRVEKRNVAIGLSTADYVEILSGLSEGDRVIVANLSSFKAGQPVTPKKSVIAEGGL
jgi:RND family efflux transporter MFP subunit